MTTTTYGLEQCTGANGAGIAGRVPTLGFGPWESGIGCFALGASVQNNMFERTSIGSGGETLHNMLSGAAMPHDSVAGSEGLEYFWDLWRPDTATAGQGSGFCFRGDGTQFNSAFADQVRLRWLRASDALVNIELRVTENTIVRQNTVVATNVPWARNTALRLGVSIRGADVTVWTEPQGGGTRTVLGIVTLTPVTLNDTNHRIYSAYAILGVTAGYKFDNGTLREQFLPTTPVVTVTVS